MWIAWILVLALLLWCRLAVHEIGHFLAARICGRRVFQVRIGARTGWPIVFRALGTRWVLHPTVVGGECIMDPPRAGRYRREKLFVSLAGPVASIGFVAVLALVASYSTEAGREFQRGAWAVVILLGVVEIVAQAASWLAPDERLDGRQALAAIRVTDAQLAEIQPRNDGVGVWLRSNEELLAGRVQAAAELLDDPALDACPELRAVVRLEHAIWLDGFDVALEHSDTLELDRERQLESSGSESAKTATEIRDGFQAWRARLVCFVYLSGGCQDDALLQRAAALIEPSTTSWSAALDPRVAVAAARGDLIHARRLNRRAVSCNSPWETQPERWCWLAFGEARAGKFARARRLLRRAQRLNSADPAVVRMAQWITPLLSTAARVPSS